LVLQGGGALGAYQGGVYEALAHYDMQPDWVAGISIGAINAALIAGNPPELRVERLRAFWRHASSAMVPTPLFPAGRNRAIFNETSAAMVAAFGAPGFFNPRAVAPWMWPPGATEALSFYDTTPLKATLERLVDFDRINGGEMRLSVGAVDIERGALEVFDNARCKIGPEHIMASGALPPGFPPVEIEGRFYWDGGIVSNTPLEFVLDAETEDDLLIFQVDLFDAHGPMPTNLLEVAQREKDIRYSSRTRLNTDANLRLKRAKMALRALIDSLPPEFEGDENVRFLRRAARENSVRVVQLIYRKRAYEGGSKDYEFSRQTMLEHWAVGVADVERFMRRESELIALPPAGGASAVDPGKHDD
jgi:NTE family protein